MNYREYWGAVKSGADVREYDRRSRKIQESLKYNTDPKATVRHHLMDTPEQIEYNNAHYELWGFNEDGTFEYGKYIIFLTKEEHLAVHHKSDETKYKMGSAMRGKHHSEETKRKMRNQVPHNKGKQTPDEVKRKLSDAHKGLHYNKGKIRTDEMKAHMSDVKKKQWVEDEDLRKRVSEGVKAKINIVKQLYHDHKLSGGSMTWNEFQRWYSTNN